MSMFFSRLLRVPIAQITSSRSMGLISSSTTTQRQISAFKKGFAHGLPNNSRSSGCKLSFTCIAALV